MNSNIFPRPLRLFFGLGALLVTALTVHAQNPVTFQIDMNSQLPTATEVFIRGSFNNWGNPPQAPAPLTNNGSGVFTGTVDIADSPGTIEQCKFFFKPGDVWEDCIGNRQFVLASGGQVLPLTAWCVNNTWPVPTNNVTFQVDMTAQILLNSYTVGQPIRVSGAMVGWNDGVDLTNNPALSGNASNVYSQILPVTGFPGSSVEYKFRANGGWENPLSTGGNNRSFQVAGGDQVLPLVFYNDASPCDLLAQDTTVTFTLHLTNGTTATDGTVFDGSQAVKINGEFNNWAPWDPLLPDMTPVGGDLYQYTTVVPKGRTIAQKFKFSLNGGDNEAGFASDHIQYVRTLGSSFTMPAAEFGTNFAAIRVESSFGNLTVGTPSGGTVPISWLGRPCVTLQTRSSLTSGSWEDLPGSESTQSTNWPNTGTQFFRLQKRP